MLAHRPRRRRKIAPSPCCAWTCRSAARSAPRTAATASSCRSRSPSRLLPCRAASCCVLASPPTRPCSPAGGRRRRQRARGPPRLRRPSFHDAALRGPCQHAAVQRNLRVGERRESTRNGDRRPASARKDGVGPVISFVLRNVRCVPAFNYTLLSVTQLWREQRVDVRFADTNALVLPPSAGGHVVPFEAGKLHAAHDADGLACGLVDAPKQRDAPSGLVAPAAAARRCSRRRREIALRSCSRRCGRRAAERRAARRRGSTPRAHPATRARGRGRSTTRGFHRVGATSTWPSSPPPRPRDVMHRRSHLGVGTSGPYGTGPPTRPRSARLGDISDNAVPGGRAPRDPPRAPVVSSSTRPRQAHRGCTSDLKELGRRARVRQLPVRALRDRRVHTVRLHRVPEGHRLAAAAIERVKALGYRRRARRRRGTRDAATARAAGPLATMRCIGVSSFFRDFCASSSSITRCLRPTTTT